MPLLSHPCRCISLLLAIFTTSAVSCRANVRLPAIFGNHMVLQQGAKIPVWGRADPGEAITVILATETVKTTADAQGTWKVDLAPVPISANPLTLVVAGANTVKFEDVLVGEVWVCSGQSNMHFPLIRAHNSSTVIPQADDPQLRLFIVDAKFSLQPETDVKGQWVISSPKTVPVFSAVGYFFGRELRRNLQRPVGLIETCFGGLGAQSFVSLSGLQKDPPFTSYIDEYQQAAANYARKKDGYPALQAKYQADAKQWQETYGTAYNAALKQWQENSEKAKAEGRPAPPKPTASPAQPAPPEPPEGKVFTATELYNGMVAPLIPYAIKGVAWYQGESNVRKAAEYRSLFARVITDWREKWGEGDFPFIYVQLANFVGESNQAANEWAFLREAQLQTLKLPATGMAVAVDVGEADNIHPGDKNDVGNRLALVAEHLAYAEPVVSSGPIYDSMKVEGGKIRLIFRETGGGLRVAASPWTPDAAKVAAPTVPTGFSIAGADKVWHPAAARIDAGTVVVSSDQVAVPVAVRYDWANNPDGNLYNKEGLPASPFRTDEW